MTGSSNIVPCVVFAFNRPDKLQQVLDALKTQERDIDRLIVFVDGPRDDRDVELVEQCKAIAREVNWIDRELHFRERNHGLPGLSDNISMIMGEYKSAVFVEDDCLPMPSFYSFMRKALNHYESEKKVFSIGGHQQIAYKYFKDYPYSLVSTARFVCLGWATWQDRWGLITPYLARYCELFDGLGNVPDVAGHDIAGIARRAYIQEKEGKGPGSWAAKVAISALWLGKVHLLPIRGLVLNIGMDSGVHCEDMPRKQRRLYSRNFYKRSFDDINWLPDVEADGHYTKRLNQHLSLIQEAGRPSWFRRELSRKIPRGVKDFLRARLGFGHPQRHDDIWTKSKSGGE